MSEARKETPIAARLKSEPGWRAVLLEQEGEQLIAKVVEVKWWGYPAPEVELPKPALLPIMNLFGSLGPGMFGMSAPEIIPIAADGRRLSPRWLVPPCEKSSEDLLAETKAWMEKVLELNPQLKEPLATERHGGAKEG